jgi:hypothetical protein
MSYRMNESHSDAARTCPTIGLTIGIRLGGGNFDHVGALLCKVVVGPIRRANRKAVAHEYPLRAALLCLAVVKEVNATSIAVAIVRYH